MRSVCWEKRCRYSFKTANALSYPDRDWLVDVVPDL